MAIEKEFTLKISTEQAQGNVDELNKSLESQENLISDIEDELLGFEKQLKKTSKTNLAARKKINDAIAKTKSRLAEEKNGLKNVNKERKTANKELKTSTENAADYSGVLGIIDKKTGGAISGFTNLTKTVGGATKGFNLMKVAIIGTGIGALLIALTSLGAAFTSTEEGQNKFAKLMNVIGVVTGNVIDIFANLGNSILSVGSALIALAKGDLGGARDAFNEAGESIGKVKDGITGFVEETKKEIAVVVELADIRANADKLERKLIGERAEANRKRAELLDKAANKADFTAKQRIGFLKEAAKVEEEITNREIELAKMRLEVQQELNEQAGSTKEDKDLEAQLAANLINLETAKLAKSKAVTAQIVGASREQAAEDKAKSEEEIANAKAVKEFKDGLKLVDEEDKIAAIQKEKEENILALEELKISETEKQQLILDIEQQFKEKKKLIEAEEKVIADEELAAFVESELGKKELTLEEEKNAALLKLEDLKGNETQRLAIIKKFADEETKINSIKRAAELNMAKNTLGNIAGALGKSSKAGKAAAAAQALINTYQGITAELATKTVTPFGFALKLANIASTAAIGFKSVKSIMATRPSGGGGAASNPAAGSSPSISSEQIPPTPPAFNIVGASNTNQLADAIGGQSQQPVQAFVVSGDVTTSQQLERNIVTGATIG